MPLVVMQLKMTPEMYASLQEAMVDISGSAPHAGQKFNQNNLIRAIIQDFFNRGYNAQDMADLIEQIGLSRGRPTKDE